MDKLGWKEGTENLVQELLEHAKNARESGARGYIEEYFEKSAARIIQLEARVELLEAELEKYRCFDD